MARRSFRPSFRATGAQNKAALDFMAGGKPHDPALQSSYDALIGGMPKQRQRAVSKPSLEPTEREIQKAILDFLRVHPKVAWAHRFNRGMMPSSYNGRESYTQFNTCRGFSDIHFLLKGGRAGYCEVKRPGRKPTEDQAEFLQRCTDAGALAFVASDCEQVQAILA